MLRFPGGRGENFQRAVDDQFQQLFIYAAGLVLSEIFHIREDLSNHRTHGMHFMTAYAIRRGFGINHHLTKGRQPGVMAP